MHLRSFSTARKATTRADDPVLGMDLVPEGMQACLMQPILKHAFCLLPSNYFCASFLLSALIRRARKPIGGSSFEGITDTISISCADLKCAD